ncbi:2OG-Fe(II) oxygenase [Paraferrimonas sp. SM1919]|uniref:2OG-Fe(II) oxygenase n=1 Tax=Paraferrimonas sp. SM1919 TaxID=2662263 RepID=UPI0013D09D16|nr:2OG-Fe(II) oxygenase [Paraferrimonas sp. SM1919]
MKNKLISSFQRDDELFNYIADALYKEGYCVVKNAIPSAMANALEGYVQELTDSQFHTARIGRDQQQISNDAIRRDSIYWINGANDIEQQWLAWCEKLQLHLNRSLMLGLYSFESQIAKYEIGDFYKRHVDAFKGQKNRVLTLVTYLNRDWLEQDGGHLVIYQDDNDTVGTHILPELGTLVIFLSEQFPHEVSAANRQRHSIAGWFRVNNSAANRLDPPQ